MNTRAIYILSLMALLAGCVSNPIAEQNKAIKLMEYKMQVYGPACERLGFEKDTNSWRDCIQREYEHTIIHQEYYRNYPYWYPYYMQPY